MLPICKSQITTEPLRLFCPPESEGDKSRSELYLLYRRLGQICLKMRHTEQVGFVPLCSSFSCLFGILTSELLCLVSIISRLLGRYQNSTTPSLLGYRTNGAVILTRVQMLLIKGKYLIPVFYPNAILSVATIFSMKKKSFVQ